MTPLAGQRLLLIGIGFYDYEAAIAAEFQSIAADLVRPHPTCTSFSMVCGQRASLAEVRSLPADAVGRGAG